jgi:3-oxoacyl-[acyl-carrier protein] reductase
MGALTDKVVVVTGASRGLGEAMAIAYAEQGADLVLAARTLDDLERVQKACVAAGAGSVTIAQTDVTSEADIEQLVGSVIEHDGRIDVFVANAGTSYGMLTDKRYKELHTYDLDIAEQILRVNALGAWLCMKHALPAMTDGSSFILIGSETGRMLSPGSGFYAISKATAEALATMAAKEVAERGVRVNILSPGGMVDTQLFGPTGMPEFLKQAVPPLPPEIIAPPAIWLASDESIGVTGATLSGRAWPTKTPAEWKQELTA